MHLSIKAERSGHLSTEQDKHWIVGSGGGTVGRSPDCDLVLEDSTRVISRVQANVAVDSNQQLIWHQKGGNPSLHNGHPICVGHQVILCDGDLIEIGDFVLTVKVESPELLGSLDPVIETLGQSIPVGWWQEEISPPNTFNEKKLSTIDDLLDGALENEHGLESVAKTPSDTGSLLHERFAMPSSNEPSQPGLPVSGEAAKNHYVELLSGLGLPTDTQLDPEQLKLLGRLMKTSIQAFVDLLAMRTMFKREMRSDVTSIIAKDNNPLKFCPNADEALRRMLAPPQAGYLNAEESIQSSLEDLLSYQRAITQALDVGFAKLVDRLKPEEILKADQVKSVLKLQHRANAWSEYERRFSEVFERGHDPFESAMGDSFREALNAYSQNGRASS